MRPSSPKIVVSRRRAVVWLLTILFIEAALALYSWTHWRPEARVGYLVKEKNGYLLGWRANTFESEIYVERLETLESALEFARGLDLGPKASGLGAEELEHLWIEERGGSYVLHWKLGATPYLHRLTFSRKTDSGFFADSFRTGAYSASPIGHAVLLLPTKNHAN